MHRDGFSLFPAVYAGRNFAPPGLLLPFTKEANGISAQTTTKMCLFFLKPTKDGGGGQPRCLAIQHFLKGFRCLAGTRAKFASGARKMCCVYSKGEKLSTGKRQISEGRQTRSLKGRKGLESCAIQTVKTKKCLAERDLLCNTQRRRNFSFLVASERRRIVYSESGLNP